MKIRFWGVRGSIPAPGADTAKYGGNTACAQLIMEEDKFIIFDCGSGIRALGKNILTHYPDKNIKSHILLSHTHWDHIQGFPFFGPAFIEGNQFIIYGPYDLNKKLEDTLAGQMEYRYFPVKLTDLKSRISIQELKGNEAVIDGVTVKAKYLNHTSPTLGFKIEHNGKALAYCTDNESYHIPSLDQKDYKSEFKKGDFEFVEFIKGVDLLIHDAQYTPEEHIQKAGWGHSNWKYAVQVAREAGVKKLVLFHHDPDHPDKFLDKMLSESQNYARSIDCDADIFLAEEEKVIEV
ncbi:MAG: MBL fold metallo-hydrolase [Armatimonadota bacterium]